MADENSLFLRLNKIKFLFNHLRAARRGPRLRLCPLFRNAFPGGGEKAVLN